MLAGPGAISTVIVVAGQAQGWVQNAVVYGAIVLTGLLSYLSLRLGEPLLGRLGKTGIRVVTRIMGLILAAVAVQFVFSGVREAFF
jgi:multiple antibiotic resistance protein